MRHRLWRLAGALAAALAVADAAAADVPKIEPNRSVPGVTKLTELAGGLSTLVVVGALIAIWAVVQGS